MLTAILDRFFAPRLSGRKPLPIDVPEWSEPIAEQHAAIWWKVKAYSTASVERIVAVCRAVAYLENHQILGDIVECGARSGGSMMASALSLLALRSTQRQIYHFDAFHGSPNLAPTHVKEAMLQTRYPWEKLRFVAGQIEATIPRHAPGDIALLRLGTNDYSSTFHSLKHLYPRLVDDGILIVDDCGQGSASNQAIEDYVRANAIKHELFVIDVAERWLVKRSQSTLVAA